MFSTDNFYRTENPKFNMVQCELRSLKMDDQIGFVRDTATAMSPRSYILHLHPSPYKILAPVDCTLRTYRAVSHTTDATLVLDKQQPAPLLSLCAIWVTFLPALPTYLGRESELPVFLCVCVFRFVDHHRCLFLF